MTTEQSKSKDNKVSVQQNKKSKYESKTGVHGSSFKK